MKKPLEYLVHLAGRPDLSWESKVADIKARAQRMSRDAVQATLNYPLVFFMHASREVRALYRALLTEAVEKKVIEEAQLHTIFCAKGMGGFTFLEQLFRDKTGEGHKLFEALSFLHEVYQRGWMDASLYKALLFNLEKPEFSLFHQFALVIKPEDVKSFKFFLSMLGDLYAEGQLSPVELQGYLIQPNSAGYTAMFQMTNAMSEHISVAFYRWFQANPMSFPLDVQYHLLLMGLPRSANIKALRANILQTICNTQLELLSLPSFITLLAESEVLPKVEKSALIWKYLKLKQVAFAEGRITEQAYPASILGGGAEPFELLAHHDARVTEQYLTFVKYALVHGYVTFSEIDTLLGLFDNGGGSILEHLLQPHQPRHAFINCLQFLDEAYENQWLSEAVYLNILLNFSSPYHSALRQLSFDSGEASLESVQSYLTILTRFIHAGIISGHMLYWLLEKKDYLGLSTLHRMVNATTHEKAQYFRAWLESHSTVLSYEQKLYLLSILHSASDIEQAYEAQCIEEVLNAEDTEVEQLVSGLGFFSIELKNNKYKGALSEEDARIWDPKLPLCSPQRSPAGVAERLPSPGGI